MRIRDHQSLGSHLSEIEAASITLQTTNSVEMATKIVSLADKKIALCTKRIHHRMSEDHVNEWKDARWHARNLKTKAEAKKTTLETRQNLYGTTQLPKTASFEHELARFAAKHPHLAAGCDHFKHVLACSMRTKIDELELEDEAKLTKFLLKIPKTEALHASVQRLITSLQTSLKIKTIQLTGLAEWMQVEHLTHTPFHKWNDKDKIKLLTQVEQILKNPFESRFSWNCLQRQLSSDPALIPLCELISNVQKANSATWLKKDFWDHVSEFERTAHRLADTPEKRAWLQECKIEGLKAYRALQPKSDPNHLIVGAGPAGLIRAAFFAVKGRQFQVIEKRDATKIPRLNTVTLGKWEAKELEVLSFLGTLAFLQDKISFGHNRPQYVEVALGDMEKALQQTIEAVTGSAVPIKYMTHISAIDNANGGDAEITLTDVKTGATHTTSFSTVTIADGAKGATAELLGISKTDLAKPTLLAFSIFKDCDPASKTIFKRLQYRITNIVLGLDLILRVALYALVHWKGLEYSYAHVVADGPSGLSRVPSHDYLLRIFRKEEHKNLKKIQKEIITLNEKIHYYQGQKRDKSDLLEQKKVTLETALHRGLEQKAMRMYGLLDFAHTLFNPRGHRMRTHPMQHEKTFLVDVHVAKAERAMVKLANTHVFLRGDACHTTDPFSGTGCKTSVEETLADQYFLQHTELATLNEMERSILNWGQEYYQQKMFDKAFEERFDYYLGTENPARFADLAVKAECVDEAECAKFLCITAKQKAKSARTQMLTKTEQQFSQTLETRLQKRLKLHASESYTLSKREGVLLQRIRDNPFLATKGKKELLAKLCILGLEEGWILALLAQNRRNSEVGI